MSLNNYLICECVNILFVLWITTLGEHLGDVC